MSRKLPDFLIIGGQRCGTSSLYRYLSLHPYTARATKKEVHYFSTRFFLDIDWYKTHFPDEGFTGEGSPYYFFHPQSPQRVYETLPDVKLVLLLRNPVDRAHSQFWHEVRMSFEELPVFEWALDVESVRLKGEREKMAADPLYNSYYHIHGSYLSRGLYHEQLVRWLKWFPREQIMIVKSEDFYSDPDEKYNDVLRFLGLPEHHLEEYEVVLKGEYPPMNDETRKQLSDFFKQPNEELYELIGENYGWQ